MAESMFIFGVLSLSLAAFFGLRSGTAKAPIPPGRQTVGSKYPPNQVNSPDNRKKISEEESGESLESQTYKRLRQATDTKKGGKSNVRFE